MDCGPTCLQMIARHYGKKISLAYIRKISKVTRIGSSLLGLSDAAEKIGFRTIGVRVTFDRLMTEVPLPCIAHWNQKHFIVVYKIRHKKILVADPACGLMKYNKSEFVRGWINTSDEGILLLLKPRNDFYINNEGFEDKELLPKKGLSFLLSYILPYKKLIVQLSLGLFISSLLQLILPFLTQSIVDVGITHKNIQFIYLVLLAQLMLFFGRTSVEILRSWTLLHVSSRINMSLVSDFFYKLMNLPIAFFDNKISGDILQRINDHQRIENFLTYNSLTTLFSLFNLAIFGSVLAFYNLNLFLFFSFGTALYVLWIFLFLKGRASLDYKRFQELSHNQNKIIEMINGMQEIKLNNAETHFRWAWENIQVKLFKINLKTLLLGQSQQVGSSLINELKNIFITIYAAKLVVEGEITLGVMLAISYIVGQLNSPVQALVGFFQGIQDARISLNRLREIHSRKNEEEQNFQASTSIPTFDAFSFRKLFFRYDEHSDYILKGIDLKIPINKVTAIVGGSGSGKTTLMKILLKFYLPSEGDVFLVSSNCNEEKANSEKVLIDSAFKPENKGFNLKDISPSVWRSKCGVVMQDGYIFSDTIANNIAVGRQETDFHRLDYAIEVSNLKDLIQNCPLGLNTRIGLDGIGLSTGQKQRILIARAVYKNPEFIFFDEATNALDANNEAIIMKNLNQFFNGRTVLIIAHRLSTVKNADQIIVIDKGEVLEKGTHEELIEKREFYHSLIKNQLEVGK